MDYLLSLSALLRLRLRAPGESSHRFSDCFSTSLSVCLASLTERCIVVVMYHFNRGSVLFIPM